ncbi:MAG: DUF4389 domain-containing protein [Thermoleophilia bacterium]|nr:DUF4389 domain-containing protein [Thermoleophilia bacterium]
MDHPIGLRLAGDLRRTRLTVAFRIILAIPHLVWVTVWGLVVWLAIIISWFATLFAGSTPQVLHEFIGQYQRYWTHVTAYLTFVADPYPGFVGDRPYPADLVIAPPAPQNRWITAFRLILAIPALVVAQVLGYLLQILAVIGWFACLFLGRMPLGLRNLNAWIIRFTMQTHGYLGLLTDRYPSFSPDPPPAVEPTPAA